MHSERLWSLKSEKKSYVHTITIYIPTTFCLFQASNRSLTDDTDTEENSTLVDTFCELTTPPPPTKKRKIAQLSSMVGQLKEIADATNSTVEENEFDVFGKHVGLQLKSLPLLLALEAQEHIQLYINRIRRQHIENANECNSSSIMLTAMQNANVDL